MSTLSRAAVLRWLGGVAPLAGTAWLTACAGGQGDASGGAPGAVNTAAVRGSVEYASTVGGSGLEWETAILARFTEHYPAAKPELLTLNGDPTQLLVAMSAAGNPPDIYLLNNDVTAFYATQNLLQPLDPLLALDKAQRDDYQPIGLRTYRVKQTQSAIPYDLNSAAVYVNRTLFQQAGVPLPAKNYKEPAWAADDLLQAAKKLTRSASGTTQKQFGYFVDTWIARWFPFLWGNGGDVFDDVNDPKVFTFMSKETEQTLQWLADLRFQQQVAPQPSDLLGTNGVKLFQAGQVAMLQENMSLMPDMDKASGLQWDAVPAAHGPKGRFTRIAGAGLGIHPASKNKDGGWAYIRFHGTTEAWTLGKGLQLTMPPTRSASAVVMEGVAPDLKKMWLDTLDYGRTQALHLKWTPLMEGDGARKYYTSALNGEISIREAMDAIKRHADSVLP